MLLLMYGWSRGHMGATQIVQLTSTVDHVTVQDSGVVVVVVTAGHGMLDFANLLYHRFWAWMTRNHMGWMHR